MKITQEVRNFADKQNQRAESILAISPSRSPEGPREGLSPAERLKSIAQMSRVYDETGWELYLVSGGREGD